MRTKGVGVITHFNPVYMNPYHKRILSVRKKHLPMTARVYKNLVTLPLYPQLTFKDIKYIANLVKKTCIELGYKP